MSLIDLLNFKGDELHTCHKYARKVKRRKNKRIKKKGLYNICVHPCVYAYREFPYACVSTPIFKFV